jgi:hypothetical protein
MPGFPLTAGAQDVNNGIGTTAVWHPWTATAKAVSVHSYWEQRRKNSPQGIGNAKSSGRAVVRARARPYAKSVLLLAVHLYLQGIWVSISTNRKRYPGMHHWLLQLAVPAGSGVIGVTGYNPTRAVLANWHRLR